MMDNLGKDLKEHYSKNRDEIQKYGRNGPKTSQNGQNSSLSPSHKSKDIFSNSLKKLLKLLRDLDQSKRDLFANPDFNVKKLYNMIDTKKEGFFNFDEFRSFFKTLDIDFKHQDHLLDLFTQFDTAQKYTLNVENLENMVYPCDRRIVREGLLNEREFYRLTMNDIRNMFSQHLKAIEVCHDIKKDLQDQKISLEALFESIDVFKSGYLGKEDLAQLLGIDDRLKAYGQKDEDLNLVIAKLDLDGDGKISFRDFFLFFSV